MTSECYRCDGDMQLTEGAALTLTAMGRDGVGEIDAFLCGECAEKVRDLLEEDAA